jgi:hypothetical protein
MKYAMWDYGLEEEAAQHVHTIRQHGLQHSPEALSLECVPVFCCRPGNCVGFVPASWILEAWEEDPESTEADENFIRELRRTDLPRGAFFVLIMHEGRYHWILDQPQSDIPTVRHLRF